MYVIADLIEQRSGMSFADFVRERVAKPLGLRDLFCGLPDALQPRMADLALCGEEMTDADYARLGMQRPPTTEVTPDAIVGFNRPEVRRAGIPGGGAITTAADVALFYQGLMLDAAGDPTGLGVWQPAMLAEALRVRTGELTDPVFRKRANRALGVIIAGDADRNFRGFGHTNSERAFGHNGAGGQIAWADPETGISIGYCTNGYDQHAVRQGRRSVAISSRAASLAI
jgi:CubicO group peptidase (beta-lactamase class C family)